MARKSGLKPKLALSDEEKVLRDPLPPLTEGERAKLRVLLSDPVMIHAWAIARRRAPGPMVADLNTALGTAIGNNRLHEMRGWALFEAALISQVNPPVLRKLVVPDDYPDKGAIK